MHVYVLIILCVSVCVVYLYFYVYFQCICTICFQLIKKLLKSAYVENREVKPAILSGNPGGAILEPTNRTIPIFSALTFCTAFPIQKFSDGTSGPKKKKSSHRAGLHNFTYLSLNTVNFFAVLTAFLFFGGEVGGGLVIPASSCIIRDGDLVKISLV